MKIPKNWNNISLNTFTKLSNLVDTDNDVTNLINRLSLLTNEPIEKIKQLKYGTVLKLVDKLSYLNELPKAKKNTWFIYKGDVFKLIDIENISNQDFIDLNDIIEFKIFKALFNPDGEDDDSRSEADERAGSGYTIEQSKREQADKNADKWKWYSFVIGLTNGNPLKLEEAFKYGFYDSCIYYLYKLENKKK